jgi:hypothetical protein
MAETRVQVAFHFTFDPAKELADIPDEITKTIAIGTELIAEKMPNCALSVNDKTKILLAMDKLVFEAQKKAKPAPKPATVSKPAEENNAQGSLL